MYSKHLVFFVHPLPSHFFYELQYFRRNAVNFTPFAKNVKIVLRSLIVCCVVIMVLTTEDFGRIVALIGIGCIDSYLVGTPDEIGMART